MKNSQKWRFTIIELLVAIAIIGILMSLLLPSIKSARVKTIAAVCLNNQKQISVGFTMYAGDNDDYFVPMMTDERFWTTTLHDFGYLVVPRAQYSYYNVTVKRVNNEDRDFVLWCPSETDHHPIADIGINGNLSWWKFDNSKHFEVQDPVDVVLVGDAFQSGSEHGEWFIHSSNWISSGISQASGGNPYPDGARHDIKAATVFVDGHGEFLNGSKVVTERHSLYTGPLDMTNPQYN